MLAATSLTISNQYQRALCFASSICDLAGKCPLILLSEMVHDKLNDTCSDVMSHLVGLQKNRAGCCKKSHKSLKDRLCECGYFCTVITALMLQHAADWIMVSVHRGQADNYFSLKQESYFFHLSLCSCLKLQCILHQLQTVPCCWQRICRWHGKKSLLPAARTSFCLSPKSYRPTLISVGWLEERRGEEKGNRFKILLHLFTNNLTKLVLLYWWEERRQKNKKGE